MQSAQQAQDYADQQVAKNNEILESVLAIHGTLLASKVAFIINTESYVSQVNLLTVGLHKQIPLDDEHAEVNFEALSAMLQILPKGRTLATDAARVMFSDEEYQLVRPFLNAASENIAAITRAVMPSVKAE